MTRIDRRHFIGSTTLILSGVGATRALAADLAPLDEAAPQAMALGYKRDTKTVDGKKYPSHAISQHCGSCQLFQGKPSDAAGPCPLFAGKSVQATGWCSAWSKKAG